MQYAIINGRTHELLAGITFYSIYSHLNWVETLMRQWCTAIESCLPPGWPPRAVQMWSENESRYSAAGGWSERSDRKAQAALLPAVCLSARRSCGRGDGQRMIITGAEHRRNTAPRRHMLRPACRHAQTPSDTYCCSKPHSVHADVHPHGANYLKLIQSAPRYRLHSK